MEKYKITTNCCVIGHGVGNLFSSVKYKFNPNSFYNNKRLFKVLYVSTIDIYKNQINVIHAVYNLIKRGYPLKLEIIGRVGNKGYFSKMSNLINKIDPNNLFINYKADLDYKIMHNAYVNADMGVFASSCETFGIILLEKMTCSLPIACSNLSSIPEIFKDSGPFFNPNNVEEISKAIELVYSDELLRKSFALKSHFNSNSHTWVNSTSLTIEYFKYIYNK